MSTWALSQGWTAERLDARSPTWNQAWFASRQQLEAPRVAAVYLVTVGRSSATARQSPPESATSSRSKR